MARFYACIRGQAKTLAGRRGSKKSGISGHIRGWDVGIRVIGGVGRLGDDEFVVYLTGGSNAKVPEKLIGVFSASAEQIAIQKNLSPVE